jgi:hypothetical protein
MIGYQIRLMHDDGSLALIYVTTCLNDDQARRMAEELMTNDIGKVEVWHDLECVHKGRSPHALQ